MYKGKRVAVVMPAYNEEDMIERAIGSIPEIVDKIYVVDDASKDRTLEKALFLAREDPRIEVISHQVNQGVGGAIVSGYKRARDDAVDITVVMAGDAQMDPEDLIPMIDPIAEGKADYTKGNRLFFRHAWGMIPHVRYLGNSFLSLLTKIASGYWHVADSQCGYTASCLEVLRKIDLDKIYKRYGMPNDMLIRLNEMNFRVKDIPTTPIYNIGEKSKMNIIKVAPRILWLLTKGFFRRMLIKYVIKDFHPLVFFYGLAFVLLFLTIPLTIRMFWVILATGLVPKVNALTVAFTVITGLQSLFFAMWMDMDYNKHLKGD